MGTVVLDENALVRLEAIVRSAGHAIMRHYGHSGEVHLKDDRSPLTAADIASHEHIIGALRAWTPDVPVVSEEGVVPSYRDRRDWDSFWLVDPLDGTKEFLSRNGEFTVNVALIDMGTPVLGAVFAPALDLLYTAGRGLGAWREEAGDSRRQLLSTPPEPHAPLVVLESRSHPSSELEAFLKTIRVARRIPLGSSLKFCWIAEGRADIYPRFGPTMEWDTAAGDCVFRYSGRFGERASPLCYNSVTLRHGPFIVGPEPVISPESAAT